MMTIHPCDAVRPAPGEPITICCGSGLVAAADVPVGTAAAKGSTEPGGVATSRATVSSLPETEAANGSTAAPLRSPASVFLPLGVTTGAGTGGATVVAALLPPKRWRWGISQ